MTLLCWGQNKLNAFEEMLNDVCVVARLRTSSKTAIVCNCQDGKPGTAP